MATLTINTSEATPRELAAVRAFLDALDNGAGTTTGATFAEDHGPTDGARVVAVPVDLAPATEAPAEPEPLQHIVATTTTAAPPPPPADDETDADDELTALEETAEEFTDPEAAAFTPAPTGRVDNNGVEFDANFCGEAAVPFYATGKTAGQWKRKRGLSETDYDTWYAARLAALPVVETASEPANTASAFAPADAPPPPPPDEAAQPGALSTAGELMAWVAEMQVAGHLDQGAVDAAYATAGLSLPDMFPPNSPELIANNVGQVFAILSAQVSA
jgi:hypothetical protein